MFINIEGLDKATIVAAMYNNSKPQGMGFLQADPANMTAEEAKDYLTPDGKIQIDYLKGRVLKLYEMKEGLRVDLYDRDLGQGAAERVISKLRS